VVSSILLCGSIVYSVFLVIIFVDLFKFLTSGIRALSLGRHCGQIFFIFVVFFFGEKKRGPQHSRTFWYIYVKNLQKQVVDLISSQKNTQFEKNNHPKRSPEGQDIEILKSIIFQGFFRGWRGDLFLFL
jgi:hypothetical protein